MVVAPRSILPVLFVTLLLDMVGIGMLIPMIPMLFTDPASPSFLLSGMSHTAQYVTAGAVTAVFGLMQFVAAPVLGELSDLLGRKRLLLAGVIVLAMSQALFGMGVATGSLVVIFGSRIMAGLAGANFSIAQAAIADVTAPEHRARNFGLIGAAFGLGFILGPLSGGLIAGAAQNPAAPFWCAAVLGMFNALWLWRMLPETHPVRTGGHRIDVWTGVRNVRRAFTEHGVRGVYAASFLYIAGFTFYTSFAGIFLVERFSLTEQSIGTYFAVVGVFIVFTQAVVLRMVTARWSERQILRVIMPVMAMALLVYTQLDNMHAVYLLIPFMTVPQGLTMATMGALISRSVGAARQGAALGINGSLMALAQGVIPLAAGGGAGLLGVRVPFVVGAVCVLGAWATLLRSRPRTV